MLGRWFVILGLGFASAAQAGLRDRPPPEAYIDPVDQQIARTGVGVPGRPSPCTHEEVTNGIKVIVGSSTEQCVRMSAPRRFKGLWRGAFESSQFCPAPATTCGDLTGDRIWLNRYPGRPHGGLYRVEFIGRQTIFKGSYGHMGVYDHEVFIDDVIKFDLIERPARPSKELIKHLKRNCAAKPGCDMKSLRQGLLLTYG